MFCPVAPKLKRRVPTGKRTKKTATNATSARLDTWTGGVIWGMHLANMKREDMLAHVRKKDGSPLQLHSVDEVIATKIKQPWLEVGWFFCGRPATRADQR